jgi:hypothetical protein
MTDSLPSLSTTGIGNSPPARNLAVSPETAVRLGGQRAHHAVALESAQCLGQLRAAGGEPVRDARVAERPGRPAIVVAEHAGRCTGEAEGGVQCRRPYAGKRQRAETRRGRERQGILRQQGRSEIARVDDRADVEAELLQQAALHLGDRYLEHHLLFAIDAEHVDDELAVAGAGGRLVLRLLPE